MIDKGRRSATADLTVHYLAPIVGGPARAVAQVARHGRRTVVVRVEVYDEASGSVAAIGTVQFMISTPPVDQESAEAVLAKESGSR